MEETGNLNNTVTSLTCTEYSDEVTYSDVGFKVNGCLPVFPYYVGAMKDPVML